MPLEPTDARQRRRRGVYRRRRAAAALSLLALGGVGVLIGKGLGGTTNASADTAEGTTPTVTQPQQTVPSPPPKATVSFAAVGDIVMGSPPFGLPADGGASFFGSVASLFTGDLVMGNLEGTLSIGGGSKCGPSPGPNCFAFRTPPEYAKWLRQAGFRVMNVANNHFDDFGETGQQETLQALSAQGLKASGRRGQVTVVVRNGVRIGIVGFSSYRWTSKLFDIPAAKRLVGEAAKRADLVVVVIHAGAEGSDRTHVRPGTETFLGENRGDSLALTHAVVDAGADLVWGSGPHVMRGMEFYKGRLIAYSLGNFAGYKVFGLGGNLSTSGVLRVTLKADGSYVTGSLAPTQIVSPGLPAPGGSAISLVRDLSRADFGSRAARIATDGTISPPSSPG